jgi:hypothetical protein
MNTKPKPSLLKDAGVGEEKPGVKRDPLKHHVMANDDYFIVDNLCC